MSPPGMPSKESDAVCPLLSTTTMALPSTEELITRRLVNTCHIATKSLCSFCTEPASTASGIKNAARFSAVFSCSREPLTVFMMSSAAPFQSSPGVFMP